MPKRKLRAGKLNHDKYRKELVNARMARKEENQSKFSIRKAQSNIESLRALKSRVSNLKTEKEWIEMKKKAETDSRLPHSIQNRIKEMPMKWFMRLLPKLVEAEISRQNIHLTDLEWDTLQIPNRIGGQRIGRSDEWKKHVN